MTFQKGHPCYSKNFFKGMKPLRSFLGRHHSETTKRKMSEDRKGMIPWNKGRKMTDYPQCGFQKGHKPIILSKEQYKAIGRKTSSKLKGRIMPLEQRIKMSEADKKKKFNNNFGIWRKKGGKSPSKENHWNWKGGITPERTKTYFSKEYKKWVKLIYTRDNFTCQKCGDNSGNNLKPHHKDSFADFLELRFDVNNGITLCKNCHIYFHSKYGTHHNNRKQLEEFLNEKQKSIITKRGRQVMV